MAKEVDTTDTARLRELLGVPIGGIISLDDIEEILSAAPALLDELDALRLENHRLRRNDTNFKIGKMSPSVIGPSDASKDSTISGLLKQAADIEAARDALRARVAELEDIYLDLEGILPSGELGPTSGNFHGWLAARDARMKREGAAEALEKIAKDKHSGGLCRALKVLYSSYENTEAPRDLTITLGLIEGSEVLAEAARLREGGE